MPILHDAAPAALWITSSAVVEYFQVEKIKPRGCDARLSKVFDLSPQRFAPTTKRPLRFLNCGVDYYPAYCKL